MQDKKRVILVSDNKYYRVASVNPVTGEILCYGKWSRDQKLIINMHQNTIDTFIDETLNISSLGGYTIASKTAELDRINTKLGQTDTLELMVNLFGQIKKLSIDIFILKKYGEEVITDDAELDLIGSFDHPVIKHSKQSEKLEKIRRKLYS